MSATDEMIPVSGQGFRALLAARPVTRGEYRQFALATGAQLPRRPAEGESASAPVINATQEEAEAYCAWLGSQQGRRYRLPSVAELQELIEVMGAAEVDPAVWPHIDRHMTQMIGGLKAHYLCEWTEEKTEVSQPGRPSRMLGSIFYPPWLREGGNNAHLQAHLLATEGFSFVTFRLAQDG